MNKLLNSSGTLTILAIVALSIWFSQIDFVTPKRNQVQGKPLEEIMHPTDPIQQPNQDWDKDFKSAVEPTSVVYKRGKK